MEEKKRSWIDLTLRASLNIQEKKNTRQRVDWNKVGVRAGRQSLRNKSEWEKAGQMRSSKKSVARLASFPSTSTAIGPSFCVCVHVNGAANKKSRGSSTSMEFFFFLSRHFQYINKIQCIRPSGIPSMIIFQQKAETHVYMICDGFWEGRKPILRIGSFWKKGSSKWARNLWHKVRVKKKKNMLEVEEMHGTRKKKNVRKEGKPSGGIPDAKEEEYRHNWWHPLVAHLILRAQFQSAIFSLETVAHFRVIHPSSVNRSFRNGSIGRSWEFFGFFLADGKSG